MSLICGENKSLIENLDKDGELKNRNELISNTYKHPEWLHFGSGNIFRSFVAIVAQKLISQKLMNTGIVICECFDEELLEKSYKPNDCLALSCTIKNNGSIDTKLVSSIAQALCVNSDAKDRETFFNYLQNSSLKIISFSITEKAYEIKDSNGQLIKQIQIDLESEPKDFKHILSNLLLGLYKRYLNNNLPLTLMPLDNCNHNGDKLKNSLLSLCKIFCDKGKFSYDFLDYLKSDKISYPLSMIDKIAPRPSEHVLKFLKDKGYKNLDICKTTKGTFYSDFVNSEETSYLVIEDHFTNGRPAFDKVNVILSSRETVELCENMKIETCLNPLQTAAALSGILLNCPYISSCMENPLVLSLVETMGQEGILVVKDPVVINPKNFLDEAIFLRMANKYIYDTPQRIATDSSSKIPIRCGLTIKKYQEKKTNEVKDLIAIPLVIALFVRYLGCKDDNYQTFTMPNDLNRDYLLKVGQRLFGNDPKDINLAIDEILKNEDIMGCNLIATGLFEKVKNMVLEMLPIQGVSKTLSKYLY